jgi:WS/DGAT/MGAT family acyltransferase
VADVPRLRERVVPTLGRFTPPEWKPDPEFNLGYHIRHLALADPGSMRQLLDLVTSLYEDPYDRSRPLWVFYLISGLEGGRSALFWKIHHAIADGIGLGYLAEYHMQREREAPPAPPVDLDKAIEEGLAAEKQASSEQPGLPSAFLRTAGHAWRRQMGIARRMAGEMALWGADPQRARDRVEGIVTGVQQTRSQLLGEGGSSAGSPLWKNRSRHRHVEVFDVPTEQARAAAKALGGSINDFFVTGAVMGALAYHEKRSATVEALNISFVVSTRTDKAIGGNSFTPTRLTVPGVAMSPRERFADISGRMAAKRSEVRGEGMLSGLAGVANLLPTSLVTGVARSQAVKMDFATSNLRGPRTPRYVSGAQVIGNYPMGPVAGTAFNLTTLSYFGNLCMGINADPAAIEEPGGLREDMLEAYETLIGVADRE